MPPRTAWVDSEQMWRLATQKRSLSNISDDHESPSTRESPSEDLFAFNDTTSTQTPSKAFRIDVTSDNGITCQVPPCHRNPPRFTDLASYELHHKQFHSLICLECKAQFPTESMLSLHIEERHDPFVEAQRAKQLYKYKCYVEGCKETFSGVVKRNQHMTIFHYFPANYYFGVVKFGIAERDSMLTRENFNDTWARPKMEKSRPEKVAIDRPEKTRMVEKKTRDEYMIVDQPTIVTTKGSGDVEMECVETPPEEEVLKNGVGLVKNPRSWTSAKMPIFAFQRHGIGSIKPGSAKLKHHLPKSKN